MRTTPPAAAETTLFCTIDTSRVNEGDEDEAQIGVVRRAIEEEMRKKEGRQDWRCAAELKNAKNTDRIKVICQDEVEMSLLYKGYAVIH
jgi:hypothetical protein